MYVDEFLRKFESMLDNPIDYDTTDIANNMLWDNRVAEWFDGWDSVFDLKAVGQTETLEEIENLLEFNNALNSEISDLLDMLINHPNVEEISFNIKKLATF